MGWREGFPLQLLLLLAVLLVPSKPDASCQWNPIVKKDSPEIFWVNMDRSKDRRASMEAHLNAVGLPHRRVKGLSLDDIYIPTDIVTTWETHNSKFYTTEKLPHRDDPQFNSIYGNMSHAVVGLLGRPKHNKLKEVGCTSSHLEAMRLAIFHNRTNSKYAIITEDDIQIPFDIDFDALIATAPPDFGILQLFNSNEGTMKATFETYRKRGDGHLWVEHKNKHFTAYWSTCAYLINREVLRPAIEKIIRKASDGRYHVQLLAGLQFPCRPKNSPCCLPNPATKGYTFIAEPPCILAGKGFQADSFIYALNKTYVLSIPLITNGAGGNQSTFHQDHVESIHHSAFQRQRTYINEMIKGSVPLPTFAKPACKEGIQIEMKLKKSSACSFTDSFYSKNATSVHWITYPDRIAQISGMAHYLSANVPWKSKRVFGMREGNLFIPNDIAATWEKKTCKSTSSELYINDTKRFDDLASKGFFGAVIGACGRGKGHHHLHDLSITASHLWAMYEAVVLPVTTSPYTLIVEDDVQFPLDIDFFELVKTAPSDFAILRLFVSEEYTMQANWDKFTQNHTNLWTEFTSVDEKHHDPLSTKAYLIHRDRLRSKIVELIPEVHWYQREKLFPVFKLIAGMNKPCYPHSCCATSADSIAFQESDGCVLAPNGHHADYFLWKLAKVYTLNLPILTSEFGEERGYKKAIKPVLDEKIRAQRRLINNLISGQVPMPSFVKFGCTEALSMH